MSEDKFVEDPVGKVFNRIGITGIASAVLTIIIGIFVISYPIEWEQFKLLIGLYLVIVGAINLIGYIFSLISKYKGERTYIETETIKLK